MDKQVIMKKVDKIVTKHIELIESKDDEKLAGKLFLLSIEAEIENMEAILEVSLLAYIMSQE